jgi:sortase A
MTDRADEEVRSHAPGRASRRARMRLALRLGERLLLIAGLIGLAVYGSACAQRSIFQYLASQDFDAALERAMQDESHDQSEWSAQRIAKYEEAQLGNIQALGRLEIPRAGLSVMLLEGTDDSTLDRAVGRIDGTALPDHGGNLGIAGHRDGFFRGLRHLEAGDELSLATRKGVTHYRVDELRIVEPSQVEVLDPTENSSITLVTCYPFYFVGKAPQRYIVHGSQIDFEPWSREILDGLASRDHGAPNGESLQ